MVTIDGTDIVSGSTIDGGEIDEITMDGDIVFSASQPLLEAINAVYTSHQSYDGAGGNGALISHDLDNMSAENFVEADDGTSRCFGCDSDTDGNVYASFDNNTVYKVDQSTMSISDQLTIDSKDGDHVGNIWCTSDDEMYLGYGRDSTSEIVHIDTTDMSIIRRSGTSNDYQIDNFTSSSGQLFPANDGNIYASTDTNGDALKFNSSLDQVDKYTGSGSYSIAISYVNSNLLYLVTEDNILHEIDPSDMSGVRTKDLLSGTGSGGGALWYGEEHIYCNSMTDMFQKIDKDTLDIIDSVDIANETNLTNGSYIMFSEESSTAFLAFYGEAGAVSIDTSTMSVDSVFINETTHGYQVAFDKPRLRYLGQF